MKRTALIVHYRVGRTDGVSLEIEKRKRVLESMGWRVELVAGPVSVGADHVIDELEFDTPANNELLHEGFTERSVSADELHQRFVAAADRIEAALTKFIQNRNASVVFIHNPAHGRNVPAVMAFNHLIQAHQVPIIAIHHDFWWERPAYARPTAPFLAEFLASIPARGEQTKHAVINSIAQVELRKRRGITASIVPDSFDFDQPSWALSEGRRALLLADAGIRPDDLILLQATRIVERKGIELAIDLAHRLNQPDLLSRLRGAKLGSGRTSGADARVVLVLGGYVEAAAESYAAALKAKIAALDTPVIWFGDRVGSDEQVAAGERPYTLWDLYGITDAVTYPSQWEGWGNQLIEAVFARRPVVVYEYPVFQADIAKEGYRVVSLGAQAEPVPGQPLVTIPARAIDHAAAQLIELLVNAEKYHSVADANWQIGQRYHSFAVLTDHFALLLGQLGLM